MNTAFGIRTVDQSGKDDSNLLLVKSPKRCDKEWLSIAGTARCTVHILCTYVQ